MVVICKCNVTIVYLALFNYWTLKFHLLYMFLILGFFTMKLHENNVVCTAEVYFDYWLYYIGIDLKLRSFPKYRLLNMHIIDCIRFCLICIVCTPCLRINRINRVLLWYINYFYLYEKKNLNIYYIIWIIIHIDKGTAQFMQSDSVDVHDFVLSYKTWTFSLIS